MKKGICIALACFLLFGMVGCGETDTDESSVALSTDAEATENSSSADSSDYSTENSSEVSEESNETSDISEESGETSEPGKEDHIIKLAYDLFEGYDLIGQNGEWLYYGTEDNLLLGRVRLDGSGKMRYDNPGINSANVEGDRIYYIDINEGNHLYAMEHDGTGVTLLSDDELIPSPYFPLSILDGKIYYDANRVEEEPGKPWYIDKYYSINTDGTDKQELMSFHIPETDGWIYTFVDEKGDRRIIKINPYHSEKTVLTDFQVHLFDVRGEWIYYTMYQGGLYRIRTDGTDNQKLCDDHVIFYDNPATKLYDETHIYYINEGDDHINKEDNRLFSLALDGTDRRQLSTIEVERPVHVSHDTVFFRTSDGLLYAVGKDGTDERYICDPDRLWVIDSGLIYQLNGQLYYIQF